MIGLSKNCLILPILNVGLAYSNCLCIRSSSCSPPGTMRTQVILLFLIEIFPKYFLPCFVIMMFSDGFLYTVYVGYFLSGVRSNSFVL